MDCFSAGCVLAELFLEGAPLFTLSQLFKYGEGEYNVDTPLGAIDDKGVRVSSPLASIIPQADVSCAEYDQTNDRSRPFRETHLRQPSAYFTGDCLPRMLLLVLT